MPAMQPGVEAGEGNQWTLYAEAILLPFCLRIVGESSAPNECSYLPMANVQMDLRNNRMTNLNKRPDAKYQEGGFEGSNADLDNSATGNRVVTGCSIGCSVCFLLNEYPGGKMKVEQHAHTYSSSLDIKGCLKMKEKLGSEAFCSQTEEECLGHISDCDFRKVILEFDQSGSEYSQVHHRTL
jgi:hypothetical protein